MQAKAVSLLLLGALCTLLLFPSGAAAAKRRKASRTTSTEDSTSSRSRQRVTATRALERLAPQAVRTKCR
jgi:hypothetical protein